ncbi:hypothetical protein Tco_1496488, partial [Tanacetum coccineum]
SFTTLEKHCITLEADSQLNQQHFQQENSVLDQNALSFNQLFELSELRAQSQEKDTVIVKLKEQIKSLKGNVDDSKVKMDMDEIETLNIELEHRVTKLAAENEHLKQTYKQLYDSIKQKRVQSKEQCDALIQQGKALDNDAIESHSNPKESKDNIEPITPKLLNKRTTHYAYIKHTQKEALVLRDIVEHVKANYPQDLLLESTFRNGTVKDNGSASVQNSKKHDNSDYVCTNGDDCMSSKNLCVFNSMNDVKFHAKPKKNKNTDSVSKIEVVQIILWYLNSSCSQHMTGDRSQLANFISKFLGTVKFENDQVAKIMGYGDYQIRNVTISRVYYVEGLGHNLFFVG